MTRNRSKTPMERASSLANRRIPKNATNRHVRVQDFMRGYEAGWNARAKSDPARLGWKRYVATAYPKPPTEPKPGEYKPGLVPQSSSNKSL